MAEASSAAERQEEIRQRYRNLKMRYVPAEDRVELARARKALADAQRAEGDRRRNRSGNPHHRKVNVRAAVQEVPRGEDGRVLPPPPLGRGRKSVARQAWELAWNDQLYADYVAQDPEPACPTPQPPKKIGRHSHEYKAWVRMYEWEQGQLALWQARQRMYREVLQRQEDETRRQAKLRELLERQSRRMGG